MLGEPCNRFSAACLLFGILRNEAYLQSMQAIKCLVMAKHNLLLFFIQCLLNEMAEHLAITIALFNVLFKQLIRKVIWVEHDNQ